MNEEVTTTRGRQVGIAGMMLGLIGTSIGKEDWGTPGLLLSIAFVFASLVFITVSLASRSQESAEARDVKTPNGN